VPVDALRPMHRAGLDAASCPAEDPIGAWKSAGMPALFGTRRDPPVSDAGRLGVKKSHRPARDATASTGIA
jgi:hypothetical protein